MEPGPSSLLQRLEQISRERPDRVLRLRGQLPLVPEPAAQTTDWEPFELLIFRGFSSSVTHPTAYDPDQSALPPRAVLGSADLLAGPLDPSNERVLAADRAVDAFLDPAAWL